MCWWLNQEMLLGAVLFCFEIIHGPYARSITTYRFNVFDLNNFLCSCVFTCQAQRNTRSFFLKNNQSFVLHHCRSIKAYFISLCQNFRSDQFLVWPHLLLVFFFTHNNNGITIIEKYICLMWSYGCTFLVLKPFSMCFNYHWRFMKQWIAFTEVPKRM